MKICYVANNRIPTEKGYGLQIMKMCESFALLGHEVELMIPLRNNPITETAFDFYKINEEAQKNIKLTYIKSPDLIRFGKVGFWLQTLIYAQHAAWRVRKNHPDVVYSREYPILLSMFLIHKNLVWETHRGEGGLGLRILLKKAKLVAITYGLVELYSKYLLDPSSYLVAPDAVDFSEFDIPHSREKCRELLGLPKSRKIALYWGHLYGWKGVQTFADSSEFFNNYESAVIVGGHEKDIEDFRKNNVDKQHLLVVGKRPRSEIALFMKAADVLVLPNTAKEKISSHYTSPLKLFEDMASGTPIVASDLPSLREILNEKNALFFTPDDPRSLYEAVKKVFADPTVGEPLAQKALEDVRHYTWEKRAQKIINFIKP